MPLVTMLVGRPSPWCRAWPRRGARAALSGLMALGATPCRAAEASAWVGSAHSAARLIEGRTPPGAPPGGAGRWAGVEIRLDPRFITYWRDPGDAGVPPSFDMTASTNLKSAEVRYPVPESLDEGGARAYGYRDDVVFPILATPLDPGQPIVLDVRIDYAVCYDICLPARADLRVALDGRPSAEADRVDEALSAVPRRARPGESGPPPRITGIRRDAGPTGPGGFTVEAETADGGGTLFVEAPEGWAFEAGLPIAVDGAPGGLRRMVFPVKRLDAPAGRPQPGAPLTLTLSTASGAIEVPVQLDAASPAP